MNNYFLAIILNLSYIFSCTIGVGWDGDYPVLWKNRDQENYVTSEVNYIQSSGSNLGYIQVTTSSSTAPYMGMNNKGFAIANSLVQSDTDINSGLIRLPIDDEYELVRKALEVCEKVSDFDSLLAQLTPTIGSNDHIQSNFAVIDNFGGAGIFEVDTFSESDSVLIDVTYLTSDDAVLYRSNHFQNLNNPLVYQELDSLADCQNLSISSNLMGNARRWCASKEYFDNLSINDNSIIKYLIKADPTLNDNRGSLLRSLSRSSSDNFYELPYTRQATYDCGAGRPPGYVYSKYSIARNKTTSSVVMKSIEGDTLNSFILVALGNPLFTPYIPIKISDFEDIQFNEPIYNEFSDHSFDLYNHIFDYFRDSIRWVDTQHLVPIDTDNFTAPNHNGTFWFIDSIENEYFNFEDGLIKNNINLSDVNNLIDSFYDDYIHGFNNNYDNPRYEVKLVSYSSNSNSSCSDHIDYDLSYAEFANRIFHIDTGISNHNWMIQDINSGDIFNLSESFNVFNPMIRESDWINLHQNGDFSIIKLYYNSQLIRDSLIIGCTNENYLEYSSINDVDDGSCLNLLGDINSDHIINVLDIQSIISLILSLHYNSIGDVNQDGILNIQDIILIIDIILGN